MPFCHCTMWSFFKGNGRCKPSVDPPRYFSISSDGQRLKTTAWAPNLNRGSHWGWKAQSFWNFFSPWLSSSVSCFSPRQEELLISGALIVRRKQTKVRDRETNMWLAQEQHRGVILNERTLLGPASGDKLAAFIQQNCCTYAPLHH